MCGGGGSFTEVSFPFVLKDGNSFYQVEMDNPWSCQDDAVTMGIAPRDDKTDELMGPAIEPSNGEIPLEIMDLGRLRDVFMEQASKIVNNKETLEDLYDVARDAIKASVDSAYNAMCAKYTDISEI